jgi:hypothetical protein
MNQYEQDEHEKRVEYHRRHSKMRAWARYGLELQDEDYDEILKRVKRKDYVASNPSRRPNQVAITVIWREHTLVVAYRPDWQIITTFLPPLDGSNGLCPYCNNSLAKAKETVKLAGLTYHVKCAGHLRASKAEIVGQVVLNDTVRQQIAEAAELKALRAQRHAELVARQKAEKEERKLEKQRSHETNQANAQANKKNRKETSAWFKDRCRDVFMLLARGEVDEAKFYLDAMIGMPKDLDPGENVAGATQWVEARIRDKKEEKQEFFASRFIPTLPGTFTPKQEDLLDVDGWPGEGD